MNTPPPILTIVIPTYERPEALARTVRSLLPQLHTDCRLIIIDNCSPTPAHDVLAPHLQAGMPVEIRRNPVNIGGNANICRCLEVSESDWTWVVGDDDVIVDGAVRLVLGAIRTSKPQSILLNFNNPALKEPVTCTSITSLMEHASQATCGNLLFITACIFRTSLLRSHLHQAYTWISTCGPHLALTLHHMFHHQSMVELYPENLRSEASIVQKGGPGLMIVYGLSQLGQLPTPWSSNRALRRYIAHQLPEPQSCIYEVLLGYRRGVQSSLGTLILFNRIARAKYPLAMRPWQWCRFLAAFARTSLRMFLQFARVIPRRVYGDETEQTRW